MEIDKKSKSASKIQESPSVSSSGKRYKNTYISEVKLKYTHVQEELPEEAVEDSQESLDSPTKPRSSPRTPSCSKSCKSCKSSKTETATASPEVNSKVSKKLF